MVDQAELFAPPQRRRLVVPAGHAAHWGIDPATTRVAVATLDALGVGAVREHAFPKLDGAQRLSVIYDETLQVVREVAASVPPGLVVLEQASGKNVPRELEQAIGVISAAVYAGVLAVSGHAVRVEWWPPGTWKLRATGFGAIPKPKKLKGQPAPAAEAYRVLTWAWDDGMDRSVRSWDCADAWGICRAAQREVMLEQR